MKVNWRKISNLLVPLVGGALLVFVLVSVTIKQKEVTCVDVEISLFPEEGNYFLDRQLVLNISAGINSVEELKGKSLKELNIFDMEMNLNKSHYVSKAFVTFGHDGVLKLHVIQKQPIFRVMPLKGNGYYVDKSGLKVPLSSNYTLRLPVVNGNIHETYEDSMFVSEKSLMEIRIIFDFIHNDPFWTAFIEQVYVDKFKGIILIPKVGNHTIVLGNSDNLEDKFSRLKIFYLEGLGKVGWEVYQQIDLSFKGQIVAKKRN
jgi:cell division protein FtsQ